MREDLIRQCLLRIKSANSSAEISSILDDIIPILKAAGISIPDVMGYFRMHQSEYETKSQDHQNTISNNNKAQVVMQLLMAKLNK
ncbi:hypothetical protein [Flavobacterium selenitireducens]|uniref:hypothetical protein n=1 Tax=Flavobacterium selenitireducens TaxID=2722704 RepID=UPI00168BE597|nr:hypothetical protein [Flavobacterium selenitireducens]MBD3581558.1 hypothetical protein [Flavobacterium selenitireducens]